MEERQHDVKGMMSQRMLRTAAMVTKGNKVADVGCDHAYTSIYLVQNGIAPEVVAMDVNAGPLERAKENVRRFSLWDKIELRLSDGLAVLYPREVDTVLIAGMGGPLMERILASYPETVRMLKELVLQPQSEIPEVRRFLHCIGYRILAEDMLFEEGKYYVILRAEHKTEASWSELEYRYGKLLLDGKSQVLARYLEEEREKAECLLAELSKADTEKAKGRSEELVKELELNRMATERLQE